MTQDNGAAAPTDEGRRIAITVKLTQTDYRRLKIHGLENRESNQDIVEIAIKTYLDSLVDK